jgi:predicted MFS family arabinose efflux permease
MLPARAWRIVALLWVAGCLNYLDRVMITTMRESLQDSIPMTEAQFGLLTTAFLLVYAALSPAAGYVADRFPRSRVVVFGLLAWSLVTWATAHATSYPQLMATRLLMGASEACFLPAALALVADYHRGETQSLATGLVLGGVMMGSALGGVGGWIAEHDHWTSAFRLFGVAGVAFAIVLAFGLRDAPRVEVAQAHDAGVRPGEAVRALFGSGAFLVALVYWGLLGVAGWMVIGWMPTYLQEHFHLSQGRAGLIATVYVNVASLIGLVVGGLWADRWSRRTRRGCLFVTAIGLAASVPAILVVASTDTLPVAIVGLTAYGLTIAFASSEMMPILCLILDPRYLATGFGVLNLFACAVGGATTYAGGAMRDAHVDVSRLFVAGAIGLLLCAVMLLFIRPRPGSAAA